jgi:hypothetical protein
LEIRLSKHQFFGFNGLLQRGWDTHTFSFIGQKSNSNQGERIDLLQEFIDIFGGDRILSLVGDREFIGNNWLLEKGIPFSIMIPKSHTVTFRNDETHKAEELLATQTGRYFKKVIVDGVRLNIAMKVLTDDFLIVVGSHHPKKLFKGYKFRWGIEVFRFGDPISIGERAWFSCGEYAFKRLR